MATEFPQSAYQTLLSRLHAPIFFDKLARDYGRVATSDAERRELLELASAIQAKKADEQVKAAASGRSLVTEVLGGVKEALARDGVLPAAATDRVRQVKEAAAAVVQDAELRDAAAAYAAYLAGQAG